MNSRLARLLFVLVLLAPMVALQGSPDLAPAWLASDLCGVPVLVLLAAAWFAMLIGAAWFPLPEESEQ